ncbi:MAG: AMP-binding protein [Desulfovibrio sp.]|uniref:phenylacetate--CoA ligase family protein n=1 Tax=Desulfovibrio sp. TaxID=885 RepID=UPI0039E6DEF2
MSARPHPASRVASRSLSAKASRRASGFGNPLDNWLAEQCGAQGADADSFVRALREARVRALTQCLEYAATRSTFYGHRLAGCDLSSITPENLHNLPFTTAQDLARWEDFLCVSRGAVQRMVTLHTSGTTGDPKRLAFTGDDLARTVDFFRVGMSQLVGAGQKLAVLLPGAVRPDGVADLLRQSLSPQGVEVCSPPPELLASADAPQENLVGEGAEALPVADATPGNVSPARASGQCSSVLAHPRATSPLDARPELAQWLVEVQPHCLVAAPGQLEGLLRYFPKSGPPGLCGLLSSADRLDPVLSHVLATVWDCTVLDHYGLTETGYGGAVECAAHDGYHMRQLDMIVEIVDFCGDEPLPPGEAGEVVITTLGREAMPLIRYRTGDVASILPGPCACGSPLPRLGPVRGRLERCGGRVRVVQMPKGGGNTPANGNQIGVAAHKGPHCATGGWGDWM